LAVWLYPPAVKAISTKPTTSPQPAPSADGKGSVVAVRIGSAAVLAPVALAAVWYGGLPFAVFVTLAGFLMAWEWCRMVFAAEHSRSQTILLSGAVLIAAMSGYVAPLPSYILSLAAFWAATVALAWYHRGGGLGWALAGVPYICLPVFALIALRSDGHYGVLCVLWLLIVIWTTDSSAFFAGRSIGGAKLAPSISPKKTWSGAIGGLIAATIAGYAFALLAQLPGPLGVAIMSAGISVVGQIGDLIESALKRRFDVKDSSNLIPGHGGVLDRLDSLITASVAALIIGALHRGYAHAAQGTLIWSW